MSDSFAAASAATYASFPRKDKTPNLEFYLLIYYNV